MKQFQLRNSLGTPKTLSSFDDLVGMICSEDSEELSLICSKYDERIFDEWFNDKYSNVPVVSTGNYLADLIASSDIWEKYDTSYMKNEKPQNVLLPPSEINEIIREILLSNNYFDLLFDGSIKEKGNLITLKNTDFIKDKNGNVNIYYEEMIRKKKKNNDKTKSRYEYKMVNVKRHIKVPCFGFYNSSNKIPFFTMSRCLDLDGVDKELRNAFRVVDSIYNQRNAQALLFTYSGGKDISHLNNLENGYSSRVHVYDLSSYLISNKRFTLVRNPKIDRKSLKKTRDYYLNRGGRGVL